MQNNFTERFKHYSNFDLLKIVSAPDSYEADAYQAAQQEINKRNIDQVEKDEYLQLLKENEAKKERTEKKINSWTNFLTNLKPIKADDQRHDLIIRGIAFYLVILTVDSIYNQFGFFIKLFKTQGFVYILSDWFNWITLVFILVLPTITFLFLKRKKMGWILLSIYSSYFVFSFLIYFFQSLFLTTKSPGMNYSLGWTIPFIVTSILWIFVFWGLNNSGVISAFKFTVKKARKITSIICGVYTVLYLILLFFVKVF